MAWLVFIYFFFYIFGSARLRKFIVPGSVFVPPYTREKKPFGKRWDRTRLASSASDAAIHYAIASRATNVAMNL